MARRAPRRADDDRSFLGTGWAFPVSLGADGGVALVDHEEDIRQSVWIILSTDLGDRLLRPDFGSGIRSFVFESISTTTMALLRHRVEDALVTWEPRIDVTKVDTTVVSPGNRVDISIEYRVRSTNTFYNLVYPFYLDEATSTVTRPAS